MAEPLERAAVEPSTTAVLPTICQRLRRLCGLLQRYQRGQLIVGLELLFDAGELHELLGELVGVQRIERILVLQLCREQRQKRLKVSGELCRPSSSGLDEDDEELDCCVVPETTGLAVVAAAAVMFVSSDPDVDAAARSEHAAVGLSRDHGRNRVLVADH